MSDAYPKLLDALREITLLGSVSSVLNWDERTQLPAKATEHRANQSSLLARMIHERATSPHIGKLLGELEASPLMKSDPDINVNVRETRRGYDRAVKLPASLVEEITRTEIMGQAAWVEARKKSEYPIFEPWLTKMLALKQKEIDSVGFRQSRYDALLDQFEPNETAAGLQRVFAGLRDPLVDLVGKITSSGKKAPLEILERKYPAAAQQAFARQAAEKVGFDFNAGRLDVSVHPFCTGLGPGDTRMTTRYDENYFGDAFFGVLHETGHGLYDQGLPIKHYGTPLGESVSLGIHESQSRLWENFVGRSRAFWKYIFPLAKQHFAQTLTDVGDEQWYFAINDVRPSLIRTESDEATYNLHILLRFELELAMLDGSITTKDLPAAWNAKMQQYLGITPPDDARGCLQDIHWSGGAIGYFPTYTLGNLYAAQLFEQAEKDLGDLSQGFAHGEFAPLLDWLRKNIHVHGKRYSARELAVRITGADLSPQPLLRHLRAKASELYGV